MYHKFGLYSNRPWAHSFKAPSFSSKRSHSFFPLDFPITNNSMWATNAEIFHNFFFIFDFCSPNYAVSCPCNWWMNDFALIYESTIVNIPKPSNLSTDGVDYLIILCTRIALNTKRSCASKAYSCSLAKWHLRRHISKWNEILKKKRIRSSAVQDFTLWLIIFKIL